MNRGAPDAALYFLVPLALTATSEALVGILFRLSKKEQRMLVLLNIATNPTLCLLLYFYRTLLLWSAVYAVALLEIAVVLIEWLLLKKLFAGKRKWFAISLACNAASFGLGTLLNVILF